MTSARLILAVDEEPEDPPFSIGRVADALRQFAKAARAQQLYLPNNPMHVRAMDSVREAFVSLWTETDAIQLQISDAEFRWWGHPVMEEPGRTSDSLPWLFYKDGIRELTMVEGFEKQDLGILLGLIQRTRLAQGEGDDLLTLLWEHEFTTLQYKYVEVGTDAGTPLVAPAHAPGERIVSPRSVESGATETLVSSSIARMDDYDATLYFLDDHEIEYLQREIRSDYSSDLRSQVVASLLDTYEQGTRATSVARRSAERARPARAAPHGSRADIAAASADRPARAVFGTPADGTRKRPRLDRADDQRGAARVTGKRGIQDGVNPYGRARATHYVRRRRRRRGGHQARRIDAGGRGRRGARPDSRSRTAGDATRDGDRPLADRLTRCDAGAGARSR